MCALNHSDVARVFNLAFVDYKVVMNGGHAEPLYVPGVRLAEIHYTQDHAASALHEAAHWCTAGQRRRRLKDYGYFYSPPPRTEVDRARFEAVEVEAQSMELLFSEAAGLLFQPSTDDVDAPDNRLGTFSHRILIRARERRRLGLPERAEKFVTALLNERTGNFGLATDG
jgi:elongation factor P hydroxylase